MVYGFYKVSGLKLGYYTIIKCKTFCPYIFLSTKAARHALVLYINGFIDWPVINEFIALFLLNVFVKALFSLNSFTTTLIFTISEVIK
jgi:hypothetical protein